LPVGDDSIPVVGSIVTLTHPKDAELPSTLDMKSTPTAVGLDAGTADVDVKMLDANGA
jgi:hypothetical protein